MKILFALAFLAVAAALPSPEEHRTPLIAHAKKTPLPDTFDDELSRLLSDTHKHIRPMPVLVADDAATIEQPMPVLVTDPDTPIGRGYGSNVIDMRPLIVPPEVLAQVAAELELERKTKKQTPKTPVVGDRVMLSEDSGVGYSQVDKVKRLPNQPQYLQPVKSKQQDEDDQPVIVRLPQIIARFVGPPLEEGIIPEPVRVAESPLDVPLRIPDIQQELPAVEQPMQRPNWVRPPEYNSPLLRDMAN